MKSPGHSVRAILKISAGTAAAQLIIVLTAPIITRIFSPSEMGVYTIIASVSSVVGAVASLRWDFAITLPGRERDAHSLTTLGAISVLAVSTLSFLIVWTVGTYVTSVRDLTPWLLLMPAAAAGQATMNMFNQLAIRHRRYSSVASRALMRAGAMVVSQIGLGLAGFRAGGLVIGLAVGNVIGILGLLRGSGVMSAEARAGRTVSTLRQNAARYRRFPLFLAPSSLLNVLGTQLPVILVAAFYGKEVVGWFGVTQSAIAMPVALVGQSVAQVYLGELSASLRSGGANQRDLFHKASFGLAVIGALLLVLLWFAAPPLFPIVFGEDWEPSGVYAAALAPGLAMQVLAVPTSQTLSVMERQEMQLFWDAFRLLLTGGSFAALAYSGVEARTAITGLGIASAFAYLVLWWLARYATKLGVRQSA